MGLFSLTQELAVDLGTANTLIIHNGKVVVDEPSIIAVNVHTGKVEAIGAEARKLYEFGGARCDRVVRKVLSRLADRQTTSSESETP